MDPDLLPLVVLGPVIGKVTPTSAVVLLEVTVGDNHRNGDARRTGVLVSVALVNSVSCERFEVLARMHNERPRGVLFDGLSPCSQYLITVSRVQVIVRLGGW